VNITAQRSKIRQATALSSALIYLLFAGLLGTLILIYTHSSYYHSRVMDSQVKKFQPVARGYTKLNFYKKLLDYRKADNPVLSEANSQKTNEETTIKRTEAVSHKVNSNKTIEANSNITTEPQAESNKAAAVNSHSAHEADIRKKPESPDSLIIRDEKCHNCLPNYFLGANTSEPSIYRGGIAGFLHHLKAGGTTVHDCINKLVSTTYTWNKETKKRNPRGLFIRNFSYDKRASWQRQSTEARLQHHFLGGIAVHGVCDAFQDSVKPPSCSYFTMLREPIDRIVSSYYYCKMRPIDILCASSKLRASEANITQWAFHQESYLFTQLTIDSGYCSRFPQTVKRPVPCWYRERAIHEQTDLEPTLEFILKDLPDRFAVIGLFEHFQESLAMFEKVYGLKFTSCGTIKANSIQGRVSRSSNAISQKVKLQLTERKKVVAELRNNPAVMKAMRYDIAIYQRAVEIYNQQKAAMIP
jgi:hypothetical protein